MKVKVLVTQLCQILCDPTDCSPTGSSIVHGILQPRILEWVAIPFSRGSYQPTDGTWVSHTAVRRIDQILIQESNKTLLDIQTNTKLN